MILITGGSGFIGGHFHNYLPHKEIVNLDLVVPAFPHQGKFFQGDIRIAADIEKAVKGNNITTILSLAAKHHDFGIGHDEYLDRKSTRLNSSHSQISYAVFCLNK